MEKVKKTTGETRETSQPRVMSGMRATGSLHIGHYFGALCNWRELQGSHQCFFGVMDWHAMTSAYQKSAELESWTREIMAEWLAWGIDGEKNTLFIQSRVPEHLELFMIFANLTPFTWLERIPSWKEARTETELKKEVCNLGRFSYAVLQAADVAIYRAHRVPVGQDQLSHLEMIRQIVRRFNRLYKGKLPEPQPLLTQESLVLGLDGKKMSKSYDNTLKLTEESESLKKKIRKIPTDPQRVRRHDKGDPERCHLFSYHQLFTSAKEREEWVVPGCKKAEIGCGECKERLFQNMDTWMQKPREKKKEYLTQKKKLDDMIEEGCVRARKEAQATLKYVKGCMGLLYP